MRLDEIFGENKTAVFSYGRFNPPHLGHQKLIQKGNELAAQVGGNFYVFPTHSYTPKKAPKENKNPLDLKTKMYFLREIFPETIFVTEQSQTLFGALAWLLEQGYKNVYMVAGDDRVKTFENIVSEYIPAINPNVSIDKAIDFDFFETISIGKRISESEKTEGISGTKARKLVIENKMEEFISIVPGNNKTKIALFKAVKEALGV